MTIRANAPIATAEDRNALSWIVARIRPDWDRKGIESALAKHPDQTLDILAAQAINAAATRADQRTPACLGLDGEHTNRARVSLGAPATTHQPLTITQLGGDCGICGVREAMHRGARIVSDDIGVHEWIAAPSTTPASPATIARAKSAALSSKETEHE